MDQPQLEVHIYQIMDDGMMKANRTDGTGWEWCWADWQRTWMNNTPQRYAYRCLPLTIINQTGWWITQPGRLHRDLAGRDGSRVDRLPVRRPRPRSGRTGSTASSARAIITWNTPFLFRTKPRGLAPARLRAGQPLQDQRPPAHRADRERLDQHVVHDELQADDPALSGAVRGGRAALPGDPAGEQRLRRPRRGLGHLPAAVGRPRAAAAPISEWDQGRRQFHEQKAQGEVKPDDWQRDYFQGRDAIGREAETDHMIKVRPPKVHHGPLPNPGG